MTKKRNVIEVLDSDIELAIPKDSGHCAIADAIARQIPNATKITVDLQTIRWTDRKQGERYVYLTPRVAQALLLDFDQGDRENCQPLTFRLDNPIQIVPVRSYPGNTRNREKAGRVAALKVRRDQGEALTSDELRTLARSEAADARHQDRPTTVGKRTVQRVGPDEHGDPSGALTVRGGEAPPLGALAHGPGRKRVFGIKSAGSPLPAGG